MADKDPAFLWETEALRTIAAPPPSPRPPSTPNRRDDDEGNNRVGEGWLTLRAASAATGIPVATLRKWALKDRIPSVLSESRSGKRRLVTLEGVRTRARNVGREIDIVAEKATSQGITPAANEDMTPPPGTMVVPIAAWDKMLLQLGNLHEAGQQLAEARERAARAETEAIFLRERLAELRAETDGGIENAPAAGEAAPGGQIEGDPPATLPSFTVYLWRSALSGLRRKR